MKKTLLVLLTLALVMGTLLLSACGGGSLEPEDPEVPATEGMEYILNSNGKGYTLAGIGSATATEIVIPKKYEGLAVTAIAPDAFAACTEIVSVEIPTGVRTIGEAAFSGCTKLESVSIPSTLTAIGSAAFYGCESLKSISVPSKVTTIGALAFYNCSSLSSVAMNGNMVEVGDKTFYGCASLTSIKLPDTVTKVGVSVFEGCTALKSLSVPFVGADKEGGANAHLGYLFGGTNAAVPEALKTVRLTNANNVGAAAFANCQNITSIVLERGIGIIGNSAFKGCTGLTEFTVPDSVTNIGNKAFEGCINLESLSLPFLGASKEESRNNYLGYIFGASDYKENTEKVPVKLASLEITAAKTLNTNALYGCENLVSLKIAKTVETIQLGAIVGCNKLESLVIPFIGENRTTKTNGFFGYAFGARGIGENETALPTSLKKVELTDLDKVYPFAFAGCTSLEDISFSCELDMIGRKAFESTAFFENADNWESGMFYVRTYLVAVSPDHVGAITLKEDTTYIAEGAMEECTTVISVTISEKLETIEIGAFKGCTGLEAVIFTKADAGWKTSGGVAINVSDSAKNVELLCTTYASVLLESSVGE